MKFDPASDIQDLWVFGEFGDVNPSITDSSTYTFLDPDTMKQTFQSEMEGCFLYSRHYNPINKYLCDALAALEGTERAQVTASGMGAIACAVLQHCRMGDEIVSGWTIYGGTYALFANFLPRYGITTRYVDITNPAAVEEAISPRTKVIYFESISNPLLEVADVPKLVELAHRRGIAVIVDNTFAPLILAPARQGADVVVHSLTKFINGSSDCVAGTICSSRQFIDQVTDINGGACMLLGPVLDSIRSAGILKNIHTLHLRIAKHSANAMYLAGQLTALGLRVHYPGLPGHRQHEVMNRLRNSEYGFGGMMVLDVGTAERANALMVAMQQAKIGLLAVSLGYFKTLFSAPGNSTSSEIPEERQREMGLSPGMIRLSVGLDQDIERTLSRMHSCLKAAGCI
jgi:methionine-gamma-lyase